MAVNTFDISKSHAGQISLSNGDLTATHLVTPWRGIGALYGYSSGKWYWEVTAHKFANEVSSHSIAIGIAISTHTVDSFIGAQDGYSIADDIRHVVSRVVERFRACQLPCPAFLAHGVSELFEIAEEAVFG